MIISHFENYRNEDGLVFIDKHPSLLKVFHKSRNFRNAINNKKFSEFVKTRISFIYPKTLYLTLSDDRAITDIESNIIEGMTRNDFIDTLNRFFDFINNLLNETTCFSRVILDLRNSTLITQTFLSNISILYNRNKDRVFVLGDDIIKNANDKFETSIFVFDSIAAIRRELLDMHKLKSHLYSYSGDCDYLTLENHIFKHLKPKLLTNIDLLIIDLRELKDIDFFSLCLLNAAIHSFAHEYGILCLLELPSDLSAKFKIINSRLINVNRDFLMNYQELSNKYQRINKINNEINIGLDYCLFTIEPSQIHLLLNALRHFFQSLSTSKYFRFDIVRSTTDVSKKVSRLDDFIAILYELIDNAVHHSDGSSYIGLGMDISDGSGINALYCYIGDTGCGLLKTIPKEFEIMKEKRNHEFMIKICFLLVEKYRDKRKESDPFGGRGLDRTRRALRNVRANAFLRTGDKFGIFENFDKISPKTMKTLNLVGTHYFLSIPLERKN